MIENLKRIRFLNKSSDLIIVLFSLIWVKDTILALIRGTMLDSTQPIFDMLFSLSLVVITIIAANRMINGMNLCSTLFVLFWILAYALFLINGEAKELCRENMSGFFLKVFPYYFLGLVLPSSKEEFDRFIVCLERLSISSIFFETLYFIYYFISGRNFAIVDQMDVSYKMYLHIMVVLWIAMKKVDFKSTLASWIGIILLFACGTRGALISIFMWAVICLKIIVHNAKLKLLISILFSFFCVLFIFFFRDAAIFFSKVFYNIGFNTRVFDYMLSDAFLDMNGRDVLYGPVIDVLKKNYTKPYGFYYDRVLLNGRYVHNVVLELMINYGVFLGFIVLLTIIVIGIRFFRGEFYPQYKEFVGILWCGICIKLFFSSSYLLEPYFFLMLGCAMQKLRNPVIYTDNHRMTKGEIQ